MCTDLVAKPDERLTEFPVKNVSADQHNQKQHKTDGAPDRETINPAGSIRIRFPFERGERLKGGRQDAPWSNRWSGKRLKDSRSRRSRRLRLRKGNLNSCWRLCDRFWNCNLRDGFHGNFRRQRLRPDRGKFQEGRQWRGLDLLKGQMDWRGGGHPKTPPRGRGKFARHHPRFFGRRR